MMRTGAGSLAGLQSLLGPAQFITSESEMEPFLVDHRKLYRGKALAVVLPRSVEDVSRILRFCSDARIGVVPHAGNTSYCGGATPDESGTQLVLSLRRLNRIRLVDALNSAITVDAGCILANVQEAARESNLFFPLSLGSEASCQIGGNIATNAGGMNVLRYGMMRDLLLGLEVVTADGKVLSSLTPLRKDNTGYDLKSLFVGSEGTLGVITAACLKLFPAPRSTATALVAVADVAAAVALLHQLRQQSGDAVNSFELIPRSAMELALQHITGLASPFDQPYAWCVLAELSSARSDDDLDHILATALAAAEGRGQVLDAVIAKSDRERAQFWRLRENIPEAQRKHGASLKHDISVPVASLPEFMARAGAWVQANVPEGLLVAYGHVGDGNLHFNISVADAVSAVSFLAREPQIKRVIHDMVRDFGGSFSAEHGIGRLKIAELAHYCSHAELSLMRSIKAAFDPRGIMNPGKMLAPIS